MMKKIVMIVSGLRYLRALISWAMLLHLWGCFFRLSQQELPLLYMPSKENTVKCSSPRWMSKIIGLRNLCRLTLKTDHMNSEADSYLLCATGDGVSGDRDVGGAEDWNDAEMNCTNSTVEKKRQNSGVKANDCEFIFGFWLLTLFGALSLF